MRIGRADRASLSPSFVRRGEVEASRLRARARIPHFHSTPKERNIMAAKKAKKAPKKAAKKSAKKAAKKSASF